MRVPAFLLPDHESQRARSGSGPGQSPARDSQTSVRPTEPSAGPVGARSGFFIPLPGHDSQLAGSKPSQELSELGQARTCSGLGQSSVRRIAAGSVRARPRDCRTSAKPGLAAGPVRPGPASGPVRAQSDLGQARTCSGFGQSSAMPGASAIIGALPMILRKCHSWAPKIAKGGARVRVHLYFVCHCKVEAGVKITSPAIEVSET